jgi:hypothetical protein
MYNRRSGGRLDDLPWMKRSEEGGIRDSTALIAGVSPSIISNARAQNPVQGGQGIEIWQNAGQVKIYSDNLTSLMKIFYRCAVCLSRRNADRVAHRARGVVRRANEGLAVGLRVGRVRESHLQCAPPCHA